MFWESIGWLMKKLLFILIVGYVGFVVFSCTSNGTPTTKTIALQPLSDFPTNLQDTIQQAIENYYHFKTIVYKDISIPKEFYTSIKSPRHRADSIIKFLKNTKSDSVSHVIGLTTKDISTTK